MSVGNSYVGRKYVIEVEQEYSANMRKGSSDMVDPIKLYKVKGFNSLVFDEQGLDKLKRMPELEQIDARMAEIDIIQKTAYENGLHDAWEIAKKIECMDGYDGDELIKMFGTDDIESIFKKHTANEVLEKIKTYEEHKKQNNIIRVGDEVRLPDNTIGVVVYSGSTGGINIFTAYGGVRYLKATKAEKTGKHYDDITNILNSLMLKQKQSEEDEGDCIELSF